ncbi:MAG TPA: hypothetical protein VET65_13140, partial [Candidatus Limnocylindrales bacterium]|nr:hypothetical protein [Candidatus Limnocylindrales bacterium]
MLTQTAFRDRRPAGSLPIEGSPADQLRVLRAGRRILQTAPHGKVTLALNQAAGRGNSRLVLLALDQLDAITLRSYQASFFDFEERTTTDLVQLLGIMDDAIAQLEAGRNRRA